MPNTYIDRGIIKWSAFDALNGYHSMLKEMQHRLGKKAKPMLSDDAYEILNRNMQVAVKEDKEVELSYYSDGYIKITYGRIKKLDFVNHLVVLTTLERIKAEDVVEMNFVE